VRTRFIDVTIHASLKPRDTRQATFVLECADNVRIEPNQPFEIVEQGCDSVRVLPLPGQVVNRSDGTIKARMVCEERYQSFDEMMQRLRRMTGTVRHLNAT